MPQKTFLAGNHEDRLRRLLWRKPPELGLLPQLQFEQLFGLDHYEFVEYKEVKRLDRLVVTHGELVRSSSGASARAHLEKYGESVLINHTHRMGAFYKPTFRTALVIFRNIGRHKAPCRVAQGGEASADVPR